MITPQYLLENIKKYPNENALSIKDSSGNWNRQSWKDFYNLTESISKSLLACNINKNDKVSIYSYNRVEWSACYAAIQQINAVSVGVYHTCSSSEVEWIVGNSDSKIVFVGNNPNDSGEKDKMPNHRLIAILDNLKNVELVVFMEGIEKLKHKKCITWKEFLAKGKDVDSKKILKRTESINENDTCSLIYTSGTTGNPKGVELSFKNWSFALSSTQEILPFNQGELYVSWLPGAHVFGQLVDCHFWIRRALHMHIVDSPLNTVDYAKEIQPHLFISVPRIYEKVYSNLINAIESKAILKIGLKLPILSSIFKKKLREAAGFGNVRFAITGAAPINPNILDLFQKLDIPLFEGWGLTETTAGATLNFAGNNKIGSVGKPLPSTEVKVAKDGELLVKGDHIMKGYYNNPEATSKEIIDNWFHTGDVGEIDNNGFVSITGRKKEIYVSSAGKNIAPLVIEETMKSIPLVSQCFLVGDNKNYCTALITLDVGVILRDKFSMDSNKIPKDPSEQLKVLISKGKKLDDFTSSEEIFGEIEIKINELNNEFSNPEQIKKFTILPRDFTIDDGELTPTLKIRRKQILENWSSEVNSMYEK